MKDKVMLVYNTVIFMSIILVLLSVIQLIFNLISIQKEYPIAIGICTTIGLISFLIDRNDYIKQNK